MHFYAKNICVNWPYVTFYFSTSKLKGNTVNIKEVTDPTSFQGSKEEKSIILEKFAFSNALAQSGKLLIQGFSRIARKKNPLF